MTILGIDTSSATLKLGLQLQQEIVVREIDQQPRHAQVILPEILGFLSAHGLTLTELTGLAYSQGPGSFTGLRIGLGVVQGLAYGLGLPVVPVPSMMVLAAAAGAIAQTDQIFVAVHAREDEVYGAFYGNCRSVVPKLIEGPSVYTALSLPDQLEGVWRITGSGAYLFEEVTHPGYLKGAIDMTEASAGQLMKIASTLFADGEVVSALEAKPLYVREMVANTKAN